MELNGSIKSFNLHKGWGFVDYNGEDIFLHKKNLNGFCPSKGDLVRFTKGQTAKGPVAENVKVVSPFEETSYYGSIKSYNFWKGYGFISSKAFPDKDVFVFWSELPGGFGPEGSPCKFRVSMDEKGPAAKKVMLLGAAGKQIWQMKWMLGYGYRGFGGFGKGRWEPCKAGVCIGMESRLVKTWLEDLRQLRHFESAPQFCEITDMIWVERVERSFVSSFF